MSHNTRAVHVETSSRMNLLISVIDHSILKTVKHLNVWHSRLFAGNKSLSNSEFEQIKPIEVADGRFEIILEVDEVYTLTTLSRGQKGTYPKPPPPKPFPVKYQDDFEGYPEHTEPFNLAQQTGTYEVVNVGPPHNHVARQMVITEPVYWCPAEGKTNRSISVIGNHTWTDVMVQVDVKVGDVNGSSGYFIAARVNRGGERTDLARGIFFYVFPNDDVFLLANDFERKDTIYGGKLYSAGTEWNNVLLYLQGGYALGAVNNVLLFNVSIPEKPKHGFAAIGTDSWGIVDFDNIKIDATMSGKNINSFNDSS